MSRLALAMREELATSRLAESLLDAGDWVVVIGRIQGRSRATGEEVDVPHLEALRFHKGKAIEGWIQMDTARVLQALGAEATAAA